MPEKAISGEAGASDLYQFSENEDRKTPDAIPGRAPATAAKVGSPREWLSADDRASILKKEYPHCLAVFASHYGFYFLTLLLALAPAPLAVNLAAAVANGLAIAYLFIIGHDCLHDAFTPSRRANRIIGRLAFVPCAFSPSLWIEEHNVAHHGRTNLRGRDHAWAPMDRESFANASPLRRWFERIYRNPVGHGLYTLIEIWLKLLIVPISPQLKNQRRRHVVDSIFTLAALTLTIAGVLALGKALSPERGLLTIFLLGWVIPFAAWCHIFGVSSYLQHTHPRIRWFDDPADWSFFRTAIRGTANIEMPEMGLGLLFDTMAHTAHHALPSVPVHRLKAAQRKLHERYRDDIISFAFTFSKYMQVVKACKLYDYTQHCWTDFNGRQTGPSLAFKDEKALPSAAGDPKAFSVA